MPLSDVQLPFALQPNNSGIKKRNLRDYKSEISALHHNGSSVARIADIFGVSRGTVYNLIDD
jgi:transposase